MSGQKLERGLQASVKIFEFCKAKLETLDDEDAACTVTRDELVGMRKAAASMNRALTALVRESHEAENRLTLELHMLRGIMKRENTDRDANRARVFEMFRRHSTDEVGSTMPAAPAGGGASTSSASANPLNAPTASAIAIDKALAGLERLEQSMRDIAPVGRVNIHGAGLLAAKQRRDELVAACAGAATSSEC